MMMQRAASSALARVRTTSTIPRRATAVTPSHSSSVCTNAAAAPSISTNIRFRRPRWHSTYSSSTFEAPPLNTYGGTAVLNDIDLHRPSPAEASVARNADPSAVFVVTGASRSMGLQFVKELLTRTQGRIAACVTDPQRAPALDEYLATLNDDDRSRVSIHPLDVTSDEQIDRLTEELTNDEVRFGRVDGLFHVAGVLGDRKSTPGPEMQLAQLDRDWFNKSLQVNAVGPMMLTKALAPLMKARKGRAKYVRTTGARESVVVNLSARVASLADNGGGLPWYTYRASKAALNQGVRTSSHELKRWGVWTLALYPGMTDTDMSRPFQTDKLRKSGVVFPVEFAVGRLMDVVDSMEEEHTGGFYDWAGQSIPF